MGLVWSYQRYQRYRREKAQVLQSQATDTHDADDERTKQLNSKKSTKTKTKFCPHRQQVPLVSGSDPPGEETQQPTAPSPQDSSEGECQICRKERLAGRRYRTLLILGLFLPFSLQALDLTIIASALPWIAADFSKYIIKLLPINNIKHHHPLTNS